MAEPGSKSKWPGLPSPQALSSLKTPLVHGPQSLQHIWKGRTETLTAQPIHAFKTEKQIITRINQEMETKTYISGSLYNPSTTLYFPPVLSLREKVINCEYGVLKLIFTIITGLDFQKPVLLIVKDDVLVGRETLLCYHIAHLCKALTFLTPPIFVCVLAQQSV